MHRRKFIQSTIAVGLAMHPLVKAWSKPASQPGRKLDGPPKPVFIYNNWSAYDELSDNVPQTEELAMRELNEIVRLKNSGVQIDYYVMDAFWFELWGGYRGWHKQHWPNGPGNWLAQCKKNNILPGMWFSTNLIASGGKRFLEVIPEWKNSLGTDPNIMCLFDGGYLNHLAGSLQLWHDRGVRLFKFDFAYFEAVTPAMKDKFTKAEIIEKNKVAFMEMLQAFRQKNPEILITGYNGFGGNMENTYTPFTEKIDPRWLDTFDTLYCGDPRFSDVPMMNIWRSQDNYSDHQVSAYHAYGMPIRRIDNCAFMIGKTGTCYYRANHCWKGMLILELARGGWLNVYHGNLELLSDKDARWFAKAQGLYRKLQQEDRTVTFGSIPGKGLPYGFISTTKHGTVCTVVNPSQKAATIEIPIHEQNGVKLIFSDGGYKVKLKDNILQLGPEQLAVVGSGEFSNEFEDHFEKAYNLGIDETVNIPLVINRIKADFRTVKKNTIEGYIYAANGNNVRIIMQQFDAKGQPYRSWPGSPPDGKKVSEVIKINVTQEGKEIPLRIEYDKVIWSGLSWGAVEVKHGTFDAGKPLLVKCSTAEKDELTLKADVYAVKYS